MLWTHCKSNPLLSQPMDRFVVAKAGGVHVPPVNVCCTGGVTPHETRVLNALLLTLMQPSNKTFCAPLVPLQSSRGKNLQRVSFRGVC